MSNTTIQLRKSGQTGNTPADLAHGELAINYADGKLFYKNGVGIKAIENQKTFSTVNSNNSLIIATSPTDILNIVSGNNIAISTNTTSKTITINSTASGGGGGDDIVARELAQGAFTAANTAASNTVYLQAVNDLQNTNITSVNTFAGSSFNSANAGVTLATAAYAQANSASSNTVYLNEINTLQNTNITSVNTFAASAFNSANAGVILATAGYNQANTASSNTVYLQSINDLQNTNITSVNTFAGSAFNSANAGVALATAAYGQANNASGNTVALQAVNSTQNTNITSINTFAGSAFASANAGVTLATAAYGQANNASGNTVALQAVNTTQNTNITAVNTFAGSAFNSANAGVTLATAAYAEANNASGNTVALQAQMTTTNTNIGYTDTLATAAYGKANAEGAINNTQNNWIASTNTFAQAAYNTANLKFNTTGGTITGNVTIQNNLVVEGNLIVIGNSTTITTNDLSITDSLIFLANGNITTDALDIGFVGHYGGLSGEEHTGFFRDPVQKEWILFEGYTDQILSNTLINIANPTFAYANLYANVVKANLISTRATVNGLDVYNTMTNAWNSANAGVTLATAAFAVANAPFQIKTQTTSNSAYYYLTMVDSDNATSNTETLYTDGALQWYPSLNFLYLNSASLSLADGNQACTYLSFGTSIDTKFFYDGTANTLNLELESDARSFNITDNGTNDFVFYKANGSLRLFSTGASNGSIILGPSGSVNVGTGGIVFSDGTIQLTNALVAAQAAYNKANGAVQTGFTTIAANSVNITPTSNADTLTITAGNNISITACTTTKTIIINSTASGGGGGGSGALTYDTAPPVSGNTVGDRWVDSEDGTLYTYINDGNSSQWVDFSTAATPASVGGGTANAILYQAGVGNTTFTSVGSQGQLLTAGVAGVPIWAAQTALSIANTQITGLITNAQLAGPLGATITNETANSTTHYPLFSATISGTLSDVDVSSTKLTYVPSTGTLSSTVITSTSDEKLKTNISTIQNPIDTIKQLRGVEYNWKDNGQRSMGVIAQEVEKTLPYLVVESNDGKSVMYQNMIGLLIEAIKEQQKQIDELRGKLNAD